MTRRICDVVGTPRCSSRKKLRLGGHATHSKLMKISIITESKLRHCITRFTRRVPGRRTVVVLSVSHLTRCFRLYAGLLHTIFVATGEKQSPFSTRRHSQLVARSLPSSSMEPSVPTRVINIPMARSASGVQFLSSLVNF